MSKVQAIQINQVARHEDGEKVAYVAVIHIGNDDGEKFTRNDEILITNQENGAQARFTIKGQQTLKKGQIAISYDGSVALKLDMSDTFSKTNKVAFVNADLLIQQPTLRHHAKETLTSPNPVVRYSALLAAVSIVKLLYDVLIDIKSLVIALYRLIF